jgi:2-polyprenyl-3-methyl-5-hydroxy-6-metoxy-1,4-benzoquinol methylase
VTRNLPSASQSAAIAHLGSCVEQLQQVPNEAIMKPLNELKVLVAIACYGVKNLHLLHEEIRRYRQMAFATDIVVLTEAPKDLGPDIEVRVGLPAKNPWSLPFAHKAVFAERVNDYDLFLYTEDDIGVSQENIVEFLKLTPHLDADEVAGFMRYETSSDGAQVLLDAHGCYHWKPESVRRRGTEIVAEFTNEHAAMYLLTREQLKSVIASGNYLKDPYEGRHDMLCTAATDVYTECGLSKVICISNLNAFLVEHMSNRYEGKWGVRRPDFDVQTRRLTSIVDGQHSMNVLADPETLIPHNEWAKSYYESPIAGVFDLVPANAKTVLSVGCGSGDTEAKLVASGFKVTAVAMDAVIAASAEERGLNIVYGSMEECMAKLRGQTFDCVVMTNLLHLLPKERSSGITNAWASFVAPGGAFIVSGPNFGSLRVRAKWALNRSSYRALSSYRRSGIETVDPHAVAKSIRPQQAQSISVRWLNEEGLAEKLGRFAATQWVLRATM